jgi:hypothetical protein
VAVAALVVTTVATTVVVAGGQGLANRWHLALVALACVGYLVLILHRGPTGLSIKLVGAAVALQTFVALVRPPSAAEDLWWYAIYGRILAVYHSNPYTHFGAEFPHDPLLAMVGHSWRHTPSVYGPAFTALSGAAALVLRSSVLETRIFYQGLAAAALVAVCVIVWRCTRSADAIVFFALSPFTAIYLVNGGRNDILVGLLLLGAVVLVQQEHAASAGIVAGLGALVKLTGMVGVVALVVAVASSGRRDVARRTGIAAGLTVVGAYALAGSSAIFTPMDTAGRLYSREAVWRLLPAIGQPLPVMHVTLAVLGIVVCWVLLRSARSGPEVAVPASLTALTLGTAYTLPGYVGWALPTAALRPRSFVARIAALQGVVLLLTYEIASDRVPGRVGADLFHVAVILGPCILLGLLVALVVGVRSPSRHDGDEGLDAPGVEAIDEPAPPQPRWQPVAGRLLGT